MWWWTCPRLSAGPMASRAAFRGPRWSSCDRAGGWTRDEPSRDAEQRGPKPPLIGDGRFAACLLGAQRLRTPRTRAAAPGTRHRIWPGSARRPRSLTEIVLRTDFRRVVIPTRTRRRMMADPDRVPMDAKRKALEALNRLGGLTLPRAAVGGGPRPIERRRHALGLMAGADLTGTRHRPAPSRRRPSARGRGSGKLEPEHLELAGVALHPERLGQEPSAVRGANLEDAPPPNHPLDGVLARVAVVIVKHE
jgi:hypothetical protein